MKTNLITLLFACSDGQKDLSDTLAQQGQDTSTDSTETDTNDSAADTDTSDSSNPTDSADTADTAGTASTYPYYWSGSIVVEVEDCTVTVSEAGVEFTEDLNGQELLQLYPCSDCDEIYYLENIEPLEACGVVFSQPIIRGVKRGAQDIQVYGLDSSGGFYLLAVATKDADVWRYSFEQNGVMVNAQVEFSLQ